MGKERIVYFDTLKGVSILLVVFCHYVLLDNHTIIGNILMASAWGAVPCFFMVTGGLMHRSEKINWRKYIWRCIRIYICLCIWKLIYLLWFAMLGTVSFSKLELVQYLFLFGDIEGVSTGLMWFMYAYLAAMLFYPVSHFLFFGGKEGKKIFFHLMVLVFSGSIGITVINFGFQVLSDLTGKGLMNVSALSKIIPIGSYPNMIFYFLIGAFLFLYHEKLQEWFKQKTGRVVIPILLILVGIVGLLLVKFEAVGTFRWDGIYFENGYNRFSTLILAVGMYFLSLCIDHLKYLNKILGYIGKETMGIFYLHFPVLALYWTYWNEQMTSYYSLVLNLVKTVIVVIICIAITKILKKIPIVRQLVL